MELTIIPVGTCWCAHSVLTPGHLDDVKFSIPISSYLVRLDDGKLLLIDTGMSKDHIGNPNLTFGDSDFSKVLTPLMDPPDDIAVQLRELGVEPEEIDYVINTHLHFDHAGNNFQFPNAVFFAQREHYEWSIDNPRTPNQYWNIPGFTYELLDGGAEVLPGIEIVPTTGHVPGHQSVIVHLPETGDLVICGDAIYIQDNLDLDNWDAHGSPSDARDSAAILTALADGGASLVYGHDPSQIDVFLRAPHVYR